MKTFFKVKIWYIVLVEFIVLGVFSWLNEFLDFPHLIYKIPKTPFNWREALFETGLIFIVTIITLIIITRIMSVRDEIEDELKKSRHDLVVKNKELAELNELKNKFLGIAAHDLRNPISTIRMTSFLFLKKIGAMSRSEQEHLLEIINSSSEYILGLVNDFLDVSKIELGVLELKKTKTDYLKFVEKSVRINIMLAERINKSIFVTCDEKIPEMGFDKYRIRQVMDNLLGNAIKYSYPDSEIGIRIFYDNGFIVTEIMDEGPGISKEHISNIFKEFYVTDLKPVNGQKTGLGLAIVKKIVEKHGGEVSARSEKDKGTVFQFKLPV